MPNTSYTNIGQNTRTQYIKLLQMNEQYDSTISVTTDTITDTKEQSRFNQKQFISSNYTIIGRYYPEEGFRFTRKCVQQEFPTHRQARVWTIFQYSIMYSNDTETTLRGESEK